VFEKLLGSLPGRLARIFVSPQKIASQVEIDLRRTNPIDINLGTEIPTLALYFRISNLSLVNLVLDRLLVDLWVGQPTLQAALLARRDIPKRSSTEDVWFRRQLTVPQQRQILDRAKGHVPSVRVTVDVEAYFESKIGWILVEKRLEHGDVPVK